MKSCSHKITHEDIVSLRLRIEEVLNRRIVTPTDYQFLADVIKERCHQSLGLSTLKRIWGYINDAGRDYKPSRYTMCVLARFIGYRDIEDYLGSKGQPMVQSATYVGKTIDAMTIKPGTRLRITWSPNRVCLLNSLGNNSFEVLESINSKLLKSDIVTCMSMTQNAPLFFNRVIRAGEQPMTYIAGSRTGIHFEIL